MIIIYLISQYILFISHTPLQIDARNYHPKSFVKEPLVYLINQLFHKLELVIYREKTIPQLKFQDPINDLNLKNQIGIKIEKVEIKSEHQSHTINQVNTQNQENLLSQNDIVNQDQYIKEDRVIKEEEQTQNQTHDQVYEKIENLEFEVKYYMKMVVKTNSYEKIKEIQSALKHESNSHNQNEQKMQIDAYPDLRKKGDESNVKDLYSNIDEQIQSYIDDQALQVLENMTQALIQVKVIRKISNLDQKSQHQNPEIESQKQQKYLIFNIQKEEDRQNHFQILSIKDFESQKEVEISQFYEYSNSQEVNENCDIKIYAMIKRQENEGLQQYIDLFNKTTIENFVYCQN